MSTPSAIIHNAGITKDAAIWLDIMENNLISIINWNLHLLPAMLLEKYGSIILISSVSGLKGNIGQTAYAGTVAHLRWELRLYKSRTLFRLHRSL
ncbi:SDR family NAD(P)-dependent oxidoreductase [Providencia rettgeri]|nr:SDR family NAD(P)-dependent oxidoreductase [Providencia rettgeri]